MNVRSAIHYGLIALVVVGLAIAAAGHVHGAYSGSEETPGRSGEPIPWLPVH